MPWKAGKNVHAVLMAPNPESAPRMGVPRTVRRETAASTKPDEGVAVGRGTEESRRRKIIAGRVLSRRRTRKCNGPPRTRLYDNGMTTRIAARRMESEAVQFSRRVLQQNQQQAAQTPNETDRGWRSSAA